MFKKMCVVMVMFVMISMGFMTGCVSDATRANQNLTTAADNFEINRRVVFYNSITDTYILSVEGRCSVEFEPNKFVVIIKVGPDEFKRHYLGRADNVFPFVEQLDSAKVDVYHYRVIFKPKTILPSFEVKG